MPNMFDHPLACVDTATNQYFALNEAGEILCQKKLPGFAFDLWVLPNGDRLVPFYGFGSSGFVVFDEQGNDKRLYTCPEGVDELFGCMPMPNGNVLLGDLQGKCLTQIAPDDTVVCKTPLFYDQENIHEIMRMPRLAKNGKDFWVVQPGLCAICCYAPDGQMLHQVPTRGDSFGVIEADNGNLIYSSIHGVFEVDLQGNEVWSLLPGDVPEMGWQWVLSLQLLQNGNLVLCNWLGHGHDGQGIPLFEVNRQKEVVWSCPVQDTIRNISAFHLLDTDAKWDCLRPAR